MPYHVVWHGSWRSIESNGLLSSRALLRHYGENEDEIVSLTQHRRSDWVEIENNNQIPVTLRDQKPLSDKGLVRALQGCATPGQWYDLINSMVFF